MNANCGILKDTYVKHYEFPEVSCNQHFTLWNAKSW